MGLTTGTKRKKLRRNMSAAKAKYKSRNEDPLLSLKFTGLKKKKGKK